MKTVRMLVVVPETIKHKLDAQREQGTTASGFIRWLLEQHFAETPTPRRQRKRHR